MRGEASSRRQIRKGHAFDRLHQLDQALINRASCITVMRFSVAIGAYGRNRAGTIRPSVGKPTDVVDFEKWGARFCDEGSRRPAAFTFAASARQRIVSDHLASNEVRGYG